MSYVEIFALGRLLLNMLFEQQLSPTIIARRLKEVLVLVPEAYKLLLEWLTYPPLSRDTKARLRCVIEGLRESVKEPEPSKVATKETIITEYKGLSHPTDIHEMSEVWALNSVKKLKQVIVLRQSLTKASNKFEAEGFPVTIANNVREVKNLLGL